MPDAGNMIDFPGSQNGLVSVPYTKKADPDLNLDHDITTSDPRATQMLIPRLVLISTKKWFCLSFYLKLPDPDPASTNSKTQSRIRIPILGLTILFLRFFSSEKPKKEHHRPKDLPHRPSFSIFRMFTVDLMMI